MTAKEAGKEAVMIVFLKVSEEATCEKDDSDVSICAFTYTDDVPYLGSVVASFDTDLLQWIVTVSGTDFTGDTDSVKLYLSDIAQTATEVSSN
jgi:hypothetical protein